MKTVTFYTIFITVLVNGGTCNFMLQKLKLRATDVPPAEGADEHPNDAEAKAIAAALEKLPHDHHAGKGNGHNAVSLAAAFEQHLPHQYAEGGVEQGGGPGGAGGWVGGWAVRGKWCGRAACGSARSEGERAGGQAWRRLAPWGSPCASWLGSGCMEVGEGGGRGNPHATHGA